MLKLKTIARSLIALLAVSACSQPPVGDFCDIAEPIRFGRAVAEAVVTGDRTAAERIDAQNRYGEQH
jgi:hypothetical protein